jgi:hypothetical protein
MPDNTWQKTRAQVRHQLTFVLLLVLLLSRVPVVHAGCLSHQDSPADCCIHDPCGAALAVPCSVMDCCQTGMPIPPTIASQNTLRCSPDATLASTLLLTVPSSNSDREDSSSPSPPLPPFLRTCALRI